MSVKSMYAFSDELVKLAGPKKKKEKGERMVDAAPPSWDSRLLRGGLGFGIMMPQIPLAKAYLKGRENVWHATNPNAAHSIMSSPAGIDPAYAGSGTRPNEGDYLSTAAEVADTVTKDDPVARSSLKKRMVAGGMPEGMEIEDLKRGAKLFEKGDKKARINRYLMGETLNRMLEEKGLNLSYEEMAANLDHFNNLMDSGQFKANQAAHIVLNELTTELVQKGKLTADKVPMLRQQLANELPRFGMRVYAGVHPADVAMWAGNESESQIAAKGVGKMVAENKKKGPFDIKRGLYTGTDVMTGGALSALHSTRERLKYKPHETVDMTRAQLLEELKRVKTEHEGILAGNEAAKLKALATGEAHRAKSGLGVVFGGEVPTGKMGYMHDFPVVRHAINFNPGVKTVLKDVFATYEPGRDLSWEHGIPSANIHTADIINRDTGHVRRVRVTDAQRAVASGLGERMHNLVLPAASLAFGAHNLYRSIRPKKRQVPESSPISITTQQREKAMQQQRWTETKGRLAESFGFPKTSGVKEDVKMVGKYVIPTAMGYTALGGVSHAVANAFIPKGQTGGDSDLQGQAREVAKAKMRNSASVFGATAMGSGVGTYLFPKLLDTNPILKEVPLQYKRRFGQIAGAGLGTMFGAMGAQGRETAQNPETDLMWSALPGKAQDFIRKHPSIGTARAAVGAAAVPMAGTYTLRKFYPGTYGKIAINWKKGLEELGEDMRKGRGLTAGERNAHARRTKATFNPKKVEQNKRFQQEFEALGVEPHDYISRYREGPDGRLQALSKQEYAAAESARQAEIAQWQARKQELLKRQHQEHRNLITQEATELGDDLEWYKKEWAKEDAEPYRWVPKHYGTDL